MSTLVTCDDYSGPVSAVCMREDGHKGDHMGEFDDYVISWPRDVKTDD